MPSGDGSERRRGERVPINAAFSKLAGVHHVSNLSEHGLFLHTEDEVPIGTSVEVKFTVLLDDPVTIEGLGTVVRHQKNPPGLGVEFGPLSPKMVLRIHDVLTRARPMPSGRPISGPDEDKRTGVFRRVEAEILDVDDLDVIATSEISTVGIPSDDDELITRQIQRSGPPPAPGSDIPDDMKTVARKPPQRDE